jgi:hypothetical protein
MGRKVLLTWALVWAVVALGAGIGTRAWADPITPGFDLLVTPSQNTTLSALVTMSHGRRSGS